MHTPEAIISFWFSDDVKPLWFNSTPEFDRQLGERFAQLIDQANNGELDSWRETPHGCLALCIVLDQFPLNIYRGKPKSFATEAMARDVARHAIESGFDGALTAEQKAFLFLPYMHSENMDDQDVSVNLFEQAGLKENLRYALHHREIVRRFGRFPHRNAILGRKSTSEEIDYLNSEEAFHG